MTRKDLLFIFAVTFASAFLAVAMYMAYCFTPSATVQQIIPVQGGPMGMPPGPMMPGPMPQQGMQPGQPPMPNPAMMQGKPPMPKHAGQPNSVAKPMPMPAPAKAKK